MSERPRYRAVLFDWNGTLNDMSVLCEQDKCVGRIELGLDLTDQDIYDAWGNPPEVFFMRLFGRSRPWQEIRQIFYDYDHLFPRRLRPEAVEILDTLDQAGIVTGVVTSGLREKVLEYMSQMGLAAARFRVLHTYAEIGDDIEAGRPILRRALGELALQGITPSEVLFVGDETATMRDAAAVGMDYVVVLGGTFSEQRLLDEGIPPERLINDLGRLPTVLGIGPPKAATSAS